MKKVFKTKEEWLNYRKGKITSTMASAILGLNPYLTNIEAWEILIGKRERENIEDKDYVQYGLKAEKHIREMFKLNHPELEVEEMKEEEWHIYISNNYDFLCASGDGTYIKEDGTKGSLEIKTSTILSSYQKESWRDGVPISYLVQCYMEMYCQETSECTLVAELKYDTDYIVRKEYYIKREDVEEDIKMVVDKCIEFYNKYVVTKTRPPLAMSF